MSQEQSAIVWTEDGVCRRILIAEDMEEVKQMIAHICTPCLQDLRGHFEIYWGTYEWIKWF